MAKKWKQRLPAPMPGLSDAQLREVVEWLDRLVQQADTAVLAMREATAVPGADFVEKNVAYWRNVSSGLTWARSYATRELARRARQAKAV